MSHALFWQRRLPWFIPVSLKSWAVTGTAGKTSVAHFLRQIWEYAGKQAASIGTTGVVAPGRDVYGNLTTPDPISLHGLLDDLAKNGVTHAAMEASSHGLDQYRLDGVNLSVAGFTNLGHDHLDYHESMESYLAAKLQLFSRCLPADKSAVIYADDAYSNQVVDAVKEAGEFRLPLAARASLSRSRKPSISAIAKSWNWNMQALFIIWNFHWRGIFKSLMRWLQLAWQLQADVTPKKLFAALETLKGASGRLGIGGKKTK